MKSKKTISGIDLKSSYSIPGSEEAGTFPYTRGISSEMYQRKMFTMRQYSGFADASESNARFHYLLKQGVTGLSIAFDLPTQMGIDPDDARALGEVGRVGVSIATQSCMSELLAGIPLDKVSISMTINSTAAILLCFLLVEAEKRNITWDKLSGTIQNDLLKEYIARGTYIYPPSPSLRIVSDIIEFCSKNIPRWNPISVSGYHIREAGSTAIQELAFTFASAITYIESLLKRGLEIDSFAPRMAFFFNCHNDFFEEIAKFRAARRIWAKLLDRKYSAKDPRSMQLRFHTQTAGSSLTAAQPLNNISRTSFQALAAVLGGTQSLHTNAFDEALALPTETSANIALRTQQIIAEETGVTKVCDPLGGSFLIEELTDQLEIAVNKELELIEKMGGMLKAIQANYPQSEIEKSSFDYQRKVENKELKIIGVNFAAEESENKIKIQKISSKLYKQRKKTIINYKQNRNQNNVQAELKALEQAAASDVNLMPYILNCVKANCSLGEISEHLAVIFGYNDK